MSLSQSDFVRLPLNISSKEDINQLFEAMPAISSCPSSTALSMKPQMYSISIGTGSLWCS